MTKVLEVNCEKAWRLIGFSLWGLVTIGIIFGMFWGYNGMIHPLKVPIEPSLSNYTQTAEDYGTQLYAYRDAINTNQATIDIFYLASLLMIVDIIGIIVAVNMKYELLEIRCK